MKKTNLLSLTLFLGLIFLVQPSQAANQTLGRFFQKPIVHNNSKSPQLTIISADEFRQSHSNSLKFIHIIRLKTTNPNIDIKSLDTVEKLKTLTFPTEKRLQAYKLYSGSFLIVRFEE